MSGSVALVAAPLILRVGHLADYFVTFCNKREICNTALTSPGRGGYQWSISTI